MTTSKNPVIYLHDLGLLSCCRSDLLICSRFARHRKSEYYYLSTTKVPILHTIS